MRRSLNPGAGSGPRPAGEGAEAVPLGVLIASFVTFTVYTALYVRIPLVPLYASDLGVSPSEVGLIALVLMGSAALASVPLGFVSDRLGRRSLALLGVLVGATTSLLLPLARSGLAIAALYLFAGLGIAAFTPSVMSLVSELAPPGYAGRVYGWLTLASQAGVSIGPAVGGAVAHALGIPIAFVVSGVLMLGAAVVGFLVLPGGRGKSQAGSRAWRAVGTTGRRLLANPLVSGAWAVAFSATFAWGTVLTFLPLYARSLDLSPAEIGLLIGAHALASAASRLPAGLVVDRLRAYGLFLVVGLLAYGAVVFAFGHTVAFPLLLLLALAGGTFNGSTFVAVGATIALGADARTRGVAMGVYTSFLYAGLALGPAVVGRAVQIDGYATGFLVAALVSAAGAAFFLLRGRGAIAAR